jgi:hypothetical protein
LAIGIGTYFFKQIRSRFLLLYVFVIIAFITESTQFILFYCGIHYNLWLGQIYFPLEFLLLALLYSKELAGGFKKWIFGVIIAFMVYSILNPILIQKFTQYSQVRSFSCIFLVVFAILYYYRVMTEAKITKLIHEPMIWVNTAVLIYFSGLLFYNILFNLILEYSIEFAKEAVFFSNILNYIFYFLIAIGFWKAGKQNNTVRG